MFRKILSFMVLCFFCVAIGYADLDVHFIDVGQGDAALLLCDGEAMLIDAGPGSASQLIYSYLRNHTDRLSYIIATHPHEDHIGGMAAALNAVPVDLIFSPVEAWDSTPFQNMVDYAAMAGTPIIVPDEGDYFHLGEALVTILHCWPEAWEVNDMSIVLRVDYGDTSFLFTGDAEEMSEYMMLDSGYDLSADVLKAGHHGSRTSSTREFIEAVRPRYSIISCGKGNSYGHPHDETLRNLAGSTILRTDQMGTIVVHSDGTTLKILHAAVGSNAYYDPVTDGSGSSQPRRNDVYYIGNRKSKKFHYPDCPGVQSMKEKNKVVLESREEAIELGYSPCGTCKP